MLSIVINYCSNEEAFIVPLLQQCSLIQHAQIIVSVGSHLYDMTPENSNHILSLKEQFPHIQFVWYTVDQPCPPSTLLQRPNAFWHNIARITGFQESNQPWILFLDADEIPDGPLLHEWIQYTLPNLPTEYAYKLANYWYFREPIYQATVIEDSPVLIHRSRITHPIQQLMTDNERDGIVDATHTQCIRHVVNTERIPMIHHFSWVRTPESMKQKVKAWGHKHDLDWEYLIDKEFSQPFSGKDFVHGYSYKTVTNSFDIQLKK
jgi:hypothetical protein